MVCAALSLRKSKKWINPVVINVAYEVTELNVLVVLNSSEGTGCALSLSFPGEELR